MTHATIILSRPQGPARPESVGARYVVDAAIAITSYTANGELITASELGLSTVSSVVITGQSDQLVVLAVGCTPGGAYATSSSFAITAMEETAGTLADGWATPGTVRVQVTGLI